MPVKIEGDVTIIAGDRNVFCGDHELTIWAINGKTIKPRHIDEALKIALGQQYFEKEVKSMGERRDHSYTDEDLQRADMANDCVGTPFHDNAPGADPIRTSGQSMGLAQEVNEARQIALERPLTEELAGEIQLQGHIEGQNYSD